MAYDTTPLAKDYTPTGLKLDGPYENDRNAVYAPLFKDIIREAFKVTDVICGHHLIYVRRDKRADGFEYEVIEEIPSADALIFDHEVAKIIWGSGWLRILQDLASTPIEDRNELLSHYYYAPDRKA